MMPTSDFTVLVIEDEHDSMEVVQGVLEYHGIHSVGTSSGEEALAVIQDLLPTLIIIDLALPGMDGWGVLKVVKGDRRFAKVPCVAITAFHTPELAEEAIAAGFDAYFAKPFDATSFVRELEGIAGDFAA